MKLGFLAIYLALAATLFSAWAYLQATWVDPKKKRADKILADTLKRARFAYYTMTSLVVLASIYLWYLLFSHQFKVLYVYQYSSRDLGFGYLLSSFWAGQEGSFLFWALMIALIGLWLIRSSRQFEARSMLFYNLVQAAFLILLIKASPFEIQQGNPPDGAGLNPLLQNPWMVIHPPILFIGYAAVSVPFALALATLWQKDFKEWVHIALPWTLFASVTLGAGIIIGGFWAYEVLGWGGYWGWDPVENSSLIAWLAVLALFHGMLVTRTTNALHKSNIALSIVSFTLVIYATYLTRSGVLADFSVHSFADRGIDAYLIIFILLAFVGGLGFMYSRRDAIPGEKIDFSKFTKESVLFYSMVVLLLSAFLTLIGTSSPILTGIAGQPSQVDISFYNDVNLPIGILIALLLSVAPFLSWRGHDFPDLMRKLTPTVASGLIVGVLGFVFGLTDVWLLLFLIVSAIAFTSNLIVFFQKLRFGFSNTAAPLGHIGLGLMFIGVIMAGRFAEDQRVLLPLEQPQNVFDLTMTYSGDFQSPDGKDGLIINVVEAGDSYEARPRLYMNDYTRSEMHEPHVERSLFSDIYISPLQVVQQGAASGHDHEHKVISKGQTVEMSGYQITFIDFDMSSHENTNAFHVGARLKVSRDGNEYDITPAVLMENGQRTSQPATFTSAGGQEILIDLHGIDAGSGRVEIALEGAASKPAQTSAPQKQLLVEVSKKPFMNVLWLGTILLTLGTIVAAKNRFA